MLIGSKVMATQSWTKNENYQPKIQFLAIIGKIINFRETMNYIFFEENQKCYILKKDSGL